MRICLGVISPSQGVRGWLQESRRGNPPPPPRGRWRVAREVQKKPMFFGFGVLQIWISNPDSFLFCIPFCIRIRMGGGVSWIKERRPLQVNKTMRSCIPFRIRHMQINLPFYARLASVMLQFHVNQVVVFVAKSNKKSNRMRIVIHIASPCSANPRQTVRRYASHSRGSSCKGLRPLTPDTPPPFPRPLQI